MIDERLLTLQWLVDSFRNLSETLVKKGNNGLIIPEHVKIEKSLKNFQEKLDDGLMQLLQSYYASQKNITNRYQENAFKELIKDQDRKLKKRIQVIQKKAQQLKKKLLMMDTFNLFCQDIGNVLSNASTLLTDIQHNKEEHDTLLTSLQAINDSYPKDKKKPTCFICYSWGIARNVMKVHALAKALKLGGIDVKLDIWENVTGSLSQFLSYISNPKMKTNFILVMCAEDLVEKWDNFVSSGQNRQQYYQKYHNSCKAEEEYKGHLVADELSRIEIRKRNELADNQTIYPVIINGTHRSSVPDNLQDLVSAELNLSDINSQAQVIRKILSILHKDNSIVPKQFEQERKPFNDIEKKPENYVLAFSPPDGTCLFYSVVLSSLLRFWNYDVNDNQQFLELDQTCRRLFSDGTKETELSLEVIKLIPAILRSHDGTTDFNLLIKRNDATLQALVENNFRKKLFQYMVNNAGRLAQRREVSLLPQLQAIDENEIKQLANEVAFANKWGQLIHVLALSEMLKICIIIHKGEEVDENAMPQKIIVLGEEYKSQDSVIHLLFTSNHYDFFINSTDIPKRLTFAPGNSDFQELINQNAFVDKSLFIKEVLEDKAQVKLITRPRRFGKTLMLSMLEYYFTNKNPEENNDLFKKMKISIVNNGKYLIHQGIYPVIFLTFKDVNSLTFKEAKEKIILLIRDLYNKFNELEKSKSLTGYDKEKYRKIRDRKLNNAAYESALRMLSELLHKHYKQKVIILIDEYDTPIHVSHRYNYYTQICDFMRTLLSSVLKDNKSLKFSVITGVLRISQEQLFSGLNNVTVYSLLDDSKYSPYFGFSKNEIRDIFPHFTDCQLATLEVWYGGYKIGIGNEKYFNPWSIISFTHKGEIYTDYWTNTGENALVDETLNDFKENKPELFDSFIQNYKKLKDDQSIKHAIDPHTIFVDLKERNEALWSLLVLSGYLTTRSYNTETKLAEICIPNQEIKQFYMMHSQRWDNEKIVCTSILNSSNNDAIKDQLMKLTINSWKFDDDIMKLVVNNLSSGSSDIRKSALSALKKYHKENDVIVVRKHQENLLHANSKIRIFSVDCLRELNQLNSKEVIKNLIEWLKAPQNEIREFGWNELKKIKIISSDEITNSLLSNLDRKVEITHQSEYTQFINFSIKCLCEIMLVKSNYSSEILLQKITSFFVHESNSIRDFSYESIKPCIVNDNPSLGVILAIEKAVTYNHQDIELQERIRSSAWKIIPTIKLTNNLFNLLNILLIEETTNMKRTIIDALKKFLESKKLTSNQINVLIDSQLDYLDTKNRTDIDIEMTIKILNALNLKLVMKIILSRLKKKKESKFYADNILQTYSLIKKIESKIKLSTTELDEIKGITIEMLINYKKDDIASNKFISSHPINLIDKEDIREIITFHIHSLSNDDIEKQIISIQILKRILIIIQYNFDEYFPIKDIFVSLLIDFLSCQNEVKESIAWELIERLREEGIASNIFETQLINKCINNLTSDVDTKIRKMILKILNSLFNPPVNIIKAVAAHRNDISDEIAEDVKKLLDKWEFENKFLQSIKEYYIENDLQEIYKIFINSNNETQKKEKILDVILKQKKNENNKFSSNLITHSHDDPSVDQVQKLEINIIKRNLPGIDANYELTFKNENEIKIFNLSWSGAQPITPKTNTKDYEQQNTVYKISVLGLNCLFSKENELRIESYNNQKNNNLSIISDGMVSITGPLKLNYLFVKSNKIEIQGIDKKTYSVGTVIIQNMLDLSADNIIIRGEINLKYFTTKIIAKILNIQYAGYLKSAISSFDGKGDNCLFFKAYIEADEVHIDKDSNITAGDISFNVKNIFDNKGIMFTKDILFKHTTTKHINEGIIWTLNKFLIKGSSFNNKGIVGSEGVLLIEIDKIKNELLLLSHALVLTTKQFINSCIVISSEALVLACNTIGQDKEIINSKDAFFLAINNIISFYEFRWVNYGILIAIKMLYFECLEFKNQQKTTPKYSYKLSEIFDILTSRINEQNFMKLTNDSSIIERIVIFLNVLLHEKNEKIFSALDKSWEETFIQKLKVEAILSSDEIKSSSKEMIDFYRNNALNIQLKINEGYCIAGKLIYIRCSKLTNSGKVISGANINLKGHRFVNEANGIVQNMFFNDMSLYANFNNNPSNISFNFNEIRLAGTIVSCLHFSSKVYNILHIERTGKIFFRKGKIYANEIIIEGEVAVNENSLSSSVIKYLFGNNLNESLLFAKTYIKLLGKISMLGKVYNSKLYPSELDNIKLKGKDIVLAGNSSAEVNGNFVVDCTNTLEVFRDVNYDIKGHVVLYANNISLSGNFIAGCDMSLFSKDKINVTSFAYVNAKNIFLKSLYFYYQGNGISVDKDICINSEKLIWLGVETDVSHFDKFKIYLLPPGEKITKKDFLTDDILLIKYHRNIMMYYKENNSINHQSVYFNKEQLKVIPSFPKIGESRHEITRNSDRVSFDIITTKCNSYILNQTRISAKNLYLCGKIIANICCDFSYIEKVFIHSLIKLELFSKQPKTFLCNSIAFLFADVNKIDNEQKLKTILYFLEISKNEHLLNDCFRSSLLELFNNKILKTIPEPLPQPLPWISKQKIDYKNLIALWLEEPHVLRIVAKLLNIDKNDIILYYLVPMLHYQEFIKNFFNIKNTALKILGINKIYKDIFDAVSINHHPQWNEEPQIILIKKYRFVKNKFKEFKQLIVSLTDNCNQKLKSVQKIITYILKNPLDSMKAIRNDITKTMENFINYYSPGLPRFVSRFFEALNENNLEEAVNAANELQQDAATREYLERINRKLYLSKPKIFTYKVYVLILKRKFTFNLISLYKILDIENIIRILVKKFPATKQLKNVISFIHRNKNYKLCNGDNYPSQLNNIARQIENETFLENRLIFSSELDDLSEEINYVNAYNFFSNIDENMEQLFCRLAYKQKLIGTTFPQQQKLKLIYELLIKRGFYLTNYDELYGRSKILPTNLERDSGSCKFKKINLDINNLCFFRKSLQSNHDSSKVVNEYNNDKSGIIRFTENDFSEFGGSVIDAGGGGDCLFRSISALLHDGNPSEHKTLRRKAVEIIESYKEIIINRYDNFFKETIVANQGHANLNNFEDYMQYMKKQGTWGGLIEIRALSHYLKRPIYVFSNDKNSHACHIFNHNLDEDLLKDEPLILFYIGNHHYRYIKSTNDTVQNIIKAAMNYIRKYNPIEDKIVRLGERIYSLQPIRRKLVVECLTSLPNEDPTYHTRRIKDVLNCELNSSDLYGIISEIFFVDLREPLINSTKLESSELKNATLMHDQVKLRYGYDGFAKLIEILSLNELNDSNRVSDEFRESDGFQAR